MRKQTNTLLSIFILLGLEIAIVVKLYLNNASRFAFLEVFFTWGIIDLLLSLTLIFGFENRFINLTYTKSGNESYIQNVYNFIGASSKNFFKRESDLSAGSRIFLLGVGNLLIYALMMVIF